jgi:hypothetical protein
LESAAWMSLLDLCGHGGPQKLLPLGDLAIMEDH